MRSIYSLSFSVLITFLHIGCCVLPLLSLASLGISGTTWLAKHQTLITTLQWALFIALGVRLAAYFIWRRSFHSRTERLAYVFGWMIALSGLIFNRLEPFKSEEQVLAEQQFDRFRSHRQLRIDLTGTYNKEALIHVLTSIEGVRRGTIGTEPGAVTFSYHKEKVTANEIFEILKDKGFVR